MKRTRWQIPPQLPQEQLASMDLPPLMVQLLYNRGISREGELLDMGQTAGVVLKSGTWYSMKHPSDGEIRLGQGQERARQFLIDNPDLATELDRAVRPFRYEVSELDVRKYVASKFEVAVVAVVEGDEGVTVASHSHGVGKADVRSGRDDLVRPADPLLVNDAEVVIAEVEIGDKHAAGGVHRYLGKCRFPHGFIYILEFPTPADFGHGVV